MNPCSHFGESCPRLGTCPCSIAVCRCRDPGGSCYVAGGERHNSGKLPLHLISPYATEGLAKVLDHGQRKYTKYGECTCGAVTVALKVSSTQNTDAGAVTKNDYASSTLNTQHDSMQMRVSGQNQIPAPNDRVTERPVSEDGLKPMGSASKRTERSSHVDASYAAGERNSASTTTTKQGPSEDASASRVTLALDGSTRKIGPIEHAPTCNALKIVSPGARNWEKGLSWEETISSLERHLLEIKKGHDFDNGPGGSGLPHVHHVQCNAMFLAHFFETHTGTDDRPKPRIDGSLQFDASQPQGPYPAIVGLPQTVGAMAKASDHPKTVSPAPAHTKYTHGSIWPSLKAWEEDMVKRRQQSDARGNGVVEEEARSYAYRGVQAP